MHFFQSKQKKSLLVHQHIECNNFPKKAKMIPIAHQKRISHLRQIELGVDKASKFTGACIVSVFVCKCFDTCQV